MTGAGVASSGRAGRLSRRDLRGEPGPQIRQEGVAGAAAGAERGGSTGSTARPIGTTKDVRGTHVVPPQAGQGASTGSSPRPRAKRASQVSSQQSAARRKGMKTTPVSCIGGLPFSDSTRRSVKPFPSCARPRRAFAKPGPSTSFSGPSRLHAAWSLPSGAWRFFVAGSEAVMTTRARPWLLAFLVLPLALAAISDSAEEKNPAELDVTERV